MITTIIIIAAAVLILAVLIFFIVWKVRSHRFRPNPDKCRQKEELDADIEEAGFAYEINGDYFYSLMNCWQRQKVADRAVEGTVRHYNRRRDRCV